MRTFVTWSLLAALTVSACTAAGSITPTPGATPLATIDREAAPTGATGHPAFRERLRLVALGDGYTAGTSTEAPNRDSWPAQLVRVINRSEMRLQLIGRNLAENGHTSGFVLTDQLPQVESLRPDVVTLQVGVNDIFTGTALEEYRSNVSAILDGLLAFLPADQIFVVTTPDHELTVKGRDWVPPRAGSVDVEQVNAVLREVAEARGIAVVDIAPVYELVTDDPGFVVDGGPSPSARQYAGWVEIIGRRIREALSSRAP